MDVKSKLASNMRNQVLKQYKLNETKRELKKKDSKITSIIYYNNEQNVLVGYNNGKLKRAENLSAVKAGNLTDTTIKKDGERLSPVQINDMNKTYRQIWQFEGETYGVKPGKIERLENGGGDITNIGDVKGWDPEFQSKLEIFQMINNGYECPDISKDLHMLQLIFRGDNYISERYLIGATWNTPFTNTIVDGMSFEIYLDERLNELSNYKILETLNNEKRDRMLKIFNIPRSFGYELVDKSKRLEMGYYCKDKKVFKTHFDNKKFINNEKMINVGINDSYLIKTTGANLSLGDENRTISQLFRKYNRTTFVNDDFSNTLTYRYFQKVKDYLTNTDQNRFTYRFIPGLIEDYSGGGAIIINDIPYETRLKNFNDVLQDILSWPSADTDSSSQNWFTQESINNYDETNKAFYDKVKRGDIVTSTEMMNLPIDGVHICFIDDFADSCGYSGSDSIYPEYKYFNIIESVKWTNTSDKLWLPSYIKLKPEYEC